MSVLGRRSGLLRTLAAAFVGMSLASCATVKVDSPLDYIGPARGAASQPGSIQALGSNLAPGVVTTQPLPTATAPAGAAPAGVAPAGVAPGAAEPSPPAEAAPAAGHEAPVGTVPAAPVVAAATQPLTVDITEAVLLSLEHNQGLAVERFVPQIRRTAVQGERARFDPDLSAQLTSSHRKGRSPTTQPHVTSASLSRGLSGQIALDEFLPTGTTISVQGSTDVSYPGTDAFDEFFGSRIGVNINQPLLRGFGPEVNLARLHQAQIDVKVSQYELRGFAETLVANVQETYWDYALAQQQIAIVEQALQLARQQMDETAVRIRTGKLAETELAASQATVALRQEDLINARSIAAKTRLSLIRLLNKNGPQMWDREIVLRSMPSVPDVDLGPVDEHVAVALRMRPDLNQARLLVQRNQLDVVQTRNGLLPQMDLFVNVGRTGYADSFGGSTHGADGLGYDVQFGGVIEYPPLNRAARAAYTRSVLSRDEQIEALRNAEQLAQVDVRTAYIEVGRTAEQIPATAATRRLQEVTLQAETEKLRVGRSTSLLVAAAQQQLLSAQIAEVQAVVGYLKALIELYRLEGSLLVRMGIQAPGFEPVTLAMK